MTEGRGRRVVMYPLVRLILGVLWVGVPVQLAQFAVKLLPAQGTIAISLLSVTTLTLVAILMYRSFVRVVERRRVTELGWTGAGPALFTGLALGAGLFATVMFALWAMNIATITSTGLWGDAAMAFGLAMLAGVGEEIIFRGLLFRIVEEWAGTWIALVASALVFGGLHLLNPNATPLAAIAIALEAGILLAASFLLTRRLWLGIGIHVAWNFAQGGVFGIPVSGVESRGLLRTALVGPDYLSGGEFGAEASVVAIMLCLAAGATLLVLADRRDAFVPFRRSAPAI